MYNSWDIHFAQGVKKAKFFFLQAKISSYTYSINHNIILPAHQGSLWYSVVDTRWPSAVALDYRFETGYPRTGSVVTAA